MVLRGALLASLTDGEKSVKNLVNDTNLRLAGLLLPHQSIGEEVTQREAYTPEDPQFEEVFAGEAHYGEPIFEEPDTSALTSRFLPGFLPGEGVLISASRPKFLFAGLSMKVTLAAKIKAQPPSSSKWLPQMMRVLTIVLC